MNKYKLLLITIMLIAASMFSCASAEKTAEVGKVNEHEKILVPEESADGVEDLMPETAPMSVSEEFEMASADEAAYGLKREGLSSAKAAASPGFSAALPATSGLKAGFSDDNRQYGFFLKFLEDYSNDVKSIDLDVSERIILKLKDAEGKSVNGAVLKLLADGNIVNGLTLADGSYQVNPAEIFHPFDRDVDLLSVEISGGISAPGFRESLIIDRNGPRTIELSTGKPRVLPDPVPLDIVFVMDTTGSMGEEISRLKDTIRIIHMNLGSMKVAADIRFGMVLYKDVGDEYRTMVVPLTSDIDQFQASLNEVEAYGGGDTPEDLEAAIGELINGIEWRAGGIKLAYVVTDAAPHLDYSTNYSCTEALRDAREKGIKIFTIGTGGLDLQGEYNLRQIAQYTSARYIFLTYGSETGESEGGTPGSVSHHSGSNWSADKLETIIIRFTREELAHLTDSPLPPEDPWFEAGKIDSETAEQTLLKLFEQSLNQLLDYSSLPVTKAVPVAVLPFSSEEFLASAAEYFNEYLILAAGTSEGVKLAERKDLGQLLSELEFQNAGLTDEDTVSRLGEFLNAEILISGNLFMKDGNYELFLRMIRVETAEILSVTRAVIDSELGL